MEGLILQITSSVNPKLPKGEKKSHLLPAFEPAVFAAFSFFFLSFSTSFFSFSFCFLSSLIFSLIFSRSFLETTPSCFSWVESRLRRISPVTLESRKLEGESLHKMDYIFAF